MEIQIETKLNLVRKAKQVTVFENRNRSIQPLQLGTQSERFYLEILTESKCACVWKFKQATVLDHPNRSIQLYGLCAKSKIFYLEIQAESNSACVCKSASVTVFIRTWCAIGKILFGNTNRILVKKIIFRNPIQNQLKFCL